MKKKKTFLLPEETINKIIEESKKMDLSLNEYVERCINVFNPYVKIKREFRKCPIKYGESGRVKK